MWKGFPETGDHGKKATNKRQVTLLLCQHPRSDVYSLLLNLEDKRSPFSGGNCFPSHPINFRAREARSAFIAEFLLKYGFVCTDFLELLSLGPLDLELVESDD